MATKNPKPAGGIGVSKRRAKTDDADEFEQGRPSIERKEYWIWAGRRSEESYPPPTNRQGKWLLFVRREAVDEVWAKTVRVLHQGRLGSVAKVSTARPNANTANPSKHVVCVYTYDADDEQDVMRVRATLREIGFEAPISYKTDEATDAGEYEVRGSKGISKYRV